VEEKLISKSELRRKVRKEIEAVTHSEITSMSKELSSSLFSFLQKFQVIQKKLLVGAYAPISGEPVWNLAFDRGDQFDFAFPFASKAGEMFFAKAMFEDLEISSEFGTDLGVPKNKTEIVEPDVLLIPGIAFSKTGERLGRGKGYFDRYLENYSGLKVGLCFEFQVKTFIPTDENDMKCDWLITDKNIYKTNPETQGEI
jgi:5-formyltetrahydrofolate cyclo-ligase